MRLFFVGDGLARPVTLDYSRIVRRWVQYVRTKFESISPRGHPECAFRNGSEKIGYAIDGKPTKPEGRPMRQHGRISRRTMFAQTRALPWRLCTRNSSFARGKLLVIVRRSLRRKRLDFLLLGKPRLQKASRTSCAQDDR